jgi:hypothetical protein
VAESAGLAAAPGQTGVEKIRRRNRWQIVLLVLLFAAPVIASYYAYYVARPSGRTNFGTLIEPQRPIPALTATNLDGQPVDLQTLKGQWLLISVGGGACDAVCQNNLYLQRQMRESFGKDMARVDWVWLVDDDQPVAPALRDVLKAAIVLRVPAAGLQQWLTAAPGHPLSDHLYVVDPQGHWMMRFPPKLDKDSAVKARGDLSKLLRISAGWDSAGRASGAPK